MKFTYFAALVAVATAQNKGRGGGDGSGTRDNGNDDGSKPAADVVVSYTREFFGAASCTSSSGAAAATTRINNYCYEENTATGDYWWKITSNSPMTIEYYITKFCSGTAATTGTFTDANTCVEAAFTPTIATANSATAGATTVRQKISASSVLTGDSAMTCSYDQMTYTDAGCNEGTIENDLKEVIGLCHTYPAGSATYRKITKCGPLDGFNWTLHSDN